MLNNLVNLKEPSVKIEGKSCEDEEVRQLWCKNQLIFKKLAEFNLPWIIRGQQCMDYLSGKIFDDTTRRIYEQVQRKICIEPLVLKNRMNTAVGRLLEARRKWKVTTEGYSNFDEIYPANIILTFIEKEIKEYNLLTKMMFNGCVTGYPQVLMFDHAVTSYEDPMAGLCGEVLPWKSVVMNKIEETDGSDLTDLVWIKRETRQELLDMHPDREDQIKEHYKDLMGGYGYGVSAYLIETSGVNAEESRYLDYDIMTGARNARSDGRLLSLRRLSIQKVNMEVAIKMGEYDETVDYQILPETWHKDRIGKWKFDHPDYRYKKEDVKILWFCKWTDCGLMLSNEAHFFQESDNKGNPIFPVALFVPQIIDGMPTGPGPDDRLLTLMKAIAETEFLHDIRTGSGDLFAYKTGTVVNHEDLPVELSVGNGIIQVNSQEVGGPIEEAISILKRTPNTAYGDYSNRVDGMLDNTDMMSPAMRGAPTSDRYAFKAQQSDIASSLTGYTIVAENMNGTIIRIKNLECMFIPYVFTEEQTIQLYIEDQNEEVELKVNEKNIGIDGKEVSITNNLSVIKWRARLEEGDDSPTARQREMNEMLIFWNTTAPVLIEADDSLMTLASVLMSMTGNRMAKHLGRVIADKAQVKAEQLSQQQLMQTMVDLESKRAKAMADKAKAKRSGFSFSITPEDLATVPGLYKILVDSDYLNPRENNMFQIPRRGEV